MPIFKPSSENAKKYFKIYSKNQKSIPYIKEYIDKSKHQIEYFENILDELTYSNDESLEQIKEEWEDWQEWENNYNFVIGFVDLLPIKAKNKRINISLPEDLLIRLDNITDNRSGFIDTALRAMLKI